MPISLRQRSRLDPKADKETRLNKRQKERQVIKEVLDTIGTPDDHYDTPMKWLWDDDHLRVNVRIKRDGAVSTVASYHVVFENGVATYSPPLARKFGLADAAIDKWLQENGPITSEDP
jgi:hypothetical protein